MDLPLKKTEEGKDEKPTNDYSGIWVGTAFVHACFGGSKFSGGTGAYSKSLDTHSVDLDSYDLKALISLRDAAGKTYQPTKGENKGSGHHRQFVLVFPKAASGSRRLELVIKDIAGVKERSFVWD